MQVAERLFDSHSQHHDERDESKVNTGDVIERSAEDDDDLSHNGFGADTNSRLHSKHYQRAASNASVKARGTESDPAQFQREHALETSSPTDAQSHVRISPTPAFVIDPSPHYETYNTRQNRTRPHAVTLDKEITEEFCATNPRVMYKKYREVLRAAESLHCQLQEKGKHCARPRGGRDQINMDKGLYKTRRDIPPHRTVDSNDSSSTKQRSTTAQMFAELQDPQLPEDYALKPPPTENMSGQPKFLTTEGRNRTAGYRPGRLAHLDYRQLVEFSYENPREAAPVYGQVLEELCEELGANTIEELRRNARKASNVCWQHQTYKDYANSACDLVGQYLAKLSEKHDGQPVHVGLEESLAIWESLLHDAR